MFSNMLCRIRLGALAAMLALALPAVAGAETGEDAAGRGADSASDPDALFTGKFKRARPGLNLKARREIRRSGMTRYLRPRFRPVSSEPFAEDWVKHTFDSDEGDGPICVGGSDYAMFTKAGDPDKLIIFLQGGGACWEGFNSCNVTAEAQFPPPAEFLPGLLAASSPDGATPNEFSDWSVAYFPYCDGSVFIGDNAVEDDPTFGVRHHRGLRNLSAGLLTARREFRRPKKILLTGASGGGAGASFFAPFLTRVLYGNRTDLFVLNDAGPVAVDPDAAPDAVAARAADWRFDQYYPESCVTAGLCDAFGQQTGLIQWRLDNDATIKEAFYSTDGDFINIGFLSVNVPGFPPFADISQFGYREILEAGHDPVNAAHPDRYRRFVVSGANPACNRFAVYTHTILLSPDLAEFGCPEVDLYYDLEAQGVAFRDWVGDFVNERDGWADIVEPFSPGPPLP